MAVADRSRSTRGSRVRPQGDAHARWERRLYREGYRVIAGLDEAGRGCWAGPLVAAAVVLPRATPKLLNRLAGLRDSKQLTALRREGFFSRIHATAVSVGVGIVSAPVVDLLGLTAAGHLAMERAARNLESEPDYLLIDAFGLPTFDCPQDAIIYGDAICLSIAAASVIAKVTRDRLLDELNDTYPAFGFARNKGYGTAQHAAALSRHGPTPEHRFRYAPIRAVLAERQLPLPVPEGAVG